MFVSAENFIGRNEFFKLFEELKEDFPKLWKVANKNSVLHKNEELLCVEISPEIGRWFDSKGIIIGAVWGGRKWREFDGFAYPHMFNTVYVNTKSQIEEWIVDGSFRQFDCNSDRLRYFTPQDNEYDSYLKMTLISHESMKEWISSGRTKSGRYNEDLPHRPLQSKEQLIQWGALRWMMTEVQG